jgi:hypothetical protein
MALAISLAINPALAVEPNGEPRVEPSNGEPSNGEPSNGEPSNTGPVNAESRNAEPFDEGETPGQMQPLPGTGPRAPVPAPRASKQRAIPTAPAPRSAASPAAPEADASRRSGVRLGAGALLHGALGTQPEPAVGVDLLLRARREWLSLNLEGRFERGLDRDLPTGGRLGTSLLGALIAPCAHFDGFAGCALGLVGSLRAESSDVPNFRTDAGLFAALGGRASVEGRLGRAVSLIGQLDTLVGVTRISVVRSEDAVWTTPPVSVTLGAGALFEIP